MPRCAGTRRATLQPTRASGSCSAEAVSNSVWIRARVKDDVPRERAHIGVRVLTLAGANEEVLAGGELLLVDAVEAASLVLVPVNSVLNLFRRVADYQGERKFLCDLDCDESTHRNGWPGLA